LKRAGWAERPAVVIAPGPSLTADDVSLVMEARRADKVRVVSVSNAWKVTHAFADAFYAADRRYWKQYFGSMVAIGVPVDHMVTCCSQSASTHGIARVRCANRPGLGLKELHSGGNSGYMSINLAFLYGARKIILLGFDNQLGPQGAKHFDGDHPLPLVQAMPFSEWYHRYDAMAKDLITAGAEVVNCSRATSLTCFVRNNLESEL